MQLTNTAQLRRNLLTDLTVEPYRSVIWLLLMVNTGPNRIPVLNSNVGFFLFGQNLRADTYVEKYFSSFFGFPPFPCFSSTDSPLTWPAQNSPGSSLLLLICLPIQLLLQVTYLTQKIHFFRQLRTQRTIEQQISVIVNFETNLTFNLLAQARNHNLNRSIGPQKYLSSMCQWRNYVQPHRIVFFSVQP